MRNFGRDTNIGSPPPEINSVIVVSNTDVVKGLTEVKDTLEYVIEEQRKERVTLDMILGQQPYPGEEP